MLKLVVQFLNLWQNIWTVIGLEVIVVVTERIDPVMVEDYTLDSTYALSLIATLVALLNPSLLVRFIKQVVTQVVEDIMS